MEFEKSLTGIEKKFYELCQTIVKEQGLKLYDMEYVPGSGTLRVFVMDEKTNSAVIEDCIKVDRAFNPYVEEEDWMPEFTLEVSSPGMYRNLKTKEHFEMALDQQINLSLKTKIDEKANSTLAKKFLKNKRFNCLLKTVSDQIIEIDCEGHVVAIDVENIKKANLEPDFNQAMNN